MRDEFFKALRSLIGIVGESEIDQIADTLEAYGNDADKQWQKAVIKSIADAVRKNGADGLEMARDRLDDILDGKPGDLSFTSLRTGSDLLAELQNAEAEKRERIKGFVQLVFETIKEAVLAAT